jgi:NADPH:quinone reductase-like Zn-dependent oxidoreductase
MKAAQFDRFGDPRVIRMVDVAIPAPGARDIVIKITASSVNAVDASHRAGKLGLVAGRRFPQGLGIDAVGTVEAMGGSVSGFAVGERVWAIRAGAGGLRKPTGLASEFAVVDARTVAHAPESLDDIQAAALVVSGYTALRALRDVLNVQPSERVLIRGAAGGVGSAAVSIATAMGGRVAAIASRRTGDLVRTLGARELFDYSTAGPMTVGPSDAIFDTVGTDLSVWRRTLTKRGRMATIAFDSPRVLAAVGMSTVHGPRRIRAFAGEPPAAQLAALSEFVDAHAIQPVVHGTYMLDDIGLAHETFAGRGIAGKLVITM